MPGLTVVSPWGAAAPSHRVRVLNWLRHLDIDCEILDYAGSRANHPGALARMPLRVLRAEARLRRPALARGGTILLQKEASPLSRGGVETRLLRRAQRSVYDFDDALQWDHLGSRMRRHFSKPNKCLAAVRRADLVIAGNHVLADWAAQWASQVVIIPSCVEPTEYPIKESYEVRRPPRLLWLGSPSAEAQIQVAAPALLEVSRRTGAVLRLVSAGNAGLGALESMVDRVEWSPAVARSIASDADVAIAPLIDGLYEQGKCAYKILEYGAAGIPVVGTPVGANRTVLDLLGGTAARNTEEWVAGLMSWIEASTDDRAAAGARARRAVECHYSYAAWSSAWQSAVCPDGE